MGDICVFEIVIMIRGCVGGSGVEVEWKWRI